MPRPTKFTPEIGEAILRHLAEGRSRRETVEALGIGRRTLQDWLRRGREGEPVFAEWAEEIERVVELARRRRSEESWERTEAESKRSWQRFKAARERWWLERLGPRAFWARRLAWLADRGRWEAYDRTIGNLRAEGFRTDGAL
jgi:hypothetical protein